MRLYLNVPYEEKDHAKKVGAIWDSTTKRWYIETGYNTTEDEIRDISSWLERDFIYGDMYVIESKRKCYKCRKETRVISLAASHYFDTEKDDDRFYVDKYDDEPDLLYLFWCENEEELPEKLVAYLKEKFFVDTIYSKTTKCSAFSNYCEHCGFLQGNYYLYYETTNSPFNTAIKGNIEKIKVYEIYNRDCINTDYPSYGVFYLPENLEYEDWIEI